MHYIYCAKLCTSMKRHFPLFIPVFAIVIAFLTGCSSDEMPASSYYRAQQMEKQFMRCYDNGQFDSVLVIARTLLPLLQADSLAIRRGNVLVNKGIVHDVHGHYDSASTCLYDALRIAESSDNYALLVRALNNIGVLYFNMRRSTEAIDTYTRLLEIVREQNDSLQISNCDNNIGNSYMTIDQDFEHAIPYFDECSRISKQIGYEQGYNVAAINLAQCLIKIGNIERAQSIIHGVRQWDSTNYYAEYTQGLIYKVKKQYDAATKIYLRILAMPLNSQEFYLALMDEMSDIRKEKGDLMGALEWRERYVAKRDSLHSVQTDRAVNELMVRYETDKKEAQIESLSNQKKLYGILTFVLGGTALMLAVALLLWWLYHKKQRQLSLMRIKQLEQQQQLMAAESLLEGENHERIRLSQELHDGLGGLLTMAKLGLEQTKHSISETGNALVLIEESITELRRISHNLMPQALSRFGLKKVIEEFCMSTSLVDFHFFGSNLRYSSKIEMNVYRIACELINNALKHSEAAKIDVQLMLTPESIDLTVIDNGRGFFYGDKQHGLTSVEQRCDLIGATIDILSSPNNGTEIAIRLTIPKQQYGTDHTQTL